MLVMKLRQIVHFDLHLTCQGFTPFNNFNRHIWKYSTVKYSVYYKGHFHKGKWSQKVSGHKKKWSQKVSYK